MSVANGVRRLLAPACCLAGLALLACGSDAGSGAKRLPDGSRLVEKKDYQALYGPEGRLERLLQDSDGDGVAETVVFFGPDGKPWRSELDTDGDHTIDRWETFRPDGSLSMRAVSRRGTGQPDAWSFVEPDGHVSRTDFDDDGDGAVDRAVGPPNGIPLPLRTP